ncbi:peptidase M28 [Kangiella sp. HD9-110m-PIT-SAG06]|nr:peptidase M28 [Kangiella sp. HD9-110m-PIT-SAG06]RDX36793.1 peptidase M28 [Kangiella sp. HD9-110m-PIT-SAG07]
MKIITIFTLLLGLATISNIAAAEDKQEPRQHNSSSQQNIPNKDNITLATEWLEYLASDDRQGRLTGSSENSEVQEWLIERFKQIGLQKVPGQESYLQKFTAHNREGEPLQAANIIGYLPCNCDSERYFFVGAHYDHVGVNTKLEGDQIFNGADDDASGVVASLIFAKTLKQYEQLPFNVVVGAWDAEEMGLQGSKYFAANPWVSLTDIESGFMFELVGVPLKDKLYNAWMTGNKYSTLYPTLKAKLKNQGWKLDPVLDPKLGLFFRSDNAPFALLDTDNESIKKAMQGKEKATVTGIPMHAISVWRGQDHYHKPHDDVSIIDTPNLVSLAESLAAAFKELPSSTKIEWLDNDQFDFSRPQ